MGEATRRKRRLTKLLDEQGTRLHAALVRLTLRHETAADLLQELFVRLGSSDAFHAASDPAGYAFRTAINLAVEWRRKRARESARMRLVNDTVRDVTSERRSPFDRLVEEEQMSAVLDAIGELTELARQCFVMRFIEELSYGVIAERLGKTPHQVRGVSHAALRQVREIVTRTPNKTEASEAAGHV